MKDIIVYIAILMIGLMLGAGLIANNTTPHETIKLSNKIIIEDKMYTCKPIESE